MELMKHFNIRFHCVRIVYPNFPDKVFNVTFIGYIIFMKNA